MKIHEALSAVMKDVGAVRKTERNTQGQGYNFRGVDNVMNAVYPALLTHGVVVVPTMLSNDYTTVEIGTKRTLMGHARLTVQFTFVGPEGDSIAAVVAAESMDVSDKATAKAHSVALRTCLLQTLMLPTDEPDPDSASYERAPKKSDEQIAQEALLEVCSNLGLEPRAVAQRFRDEVGADIHQADAASINAFAETLLADGIPA